MLIQVATYLPLVETQLRPRKNLVNETLNYRGEFASTCRLRCGQRDVDSW
ncbi:MAG: hypothetical protein JHC20_05500 [Pyrobaculum sp.]|nr:hypothetical protein [Pyrobaculum sp.]